MLLYHESDQPLSHCILGHYYHRRFLTKLAQHCASIVPLPTISTRNFAIYKLTAEICHCALFRLTHCAVKSSETYNLTIDPSRLLSISCDPIFEARLTAFHTWPFLGISFAGWRVDEIYNA
jgi:hypothetical protein